MPEAARWIASPDTPLSYLLAGADRVSADEIRSRLIRKHLGAEPEPGARTDLDAATASPDQITDALRTMPLFSQRLVITIEHAEKLKSFENHEAIAEALVAKEADRLVILHSDEAQRDLLADKVLSRLIQKNRAAYFYEPSDERKAVAWLRAYCERHKLTISLRAAETLVALVGVKTSDLAQEARKIAFARGEISEQAVEELVVRYGESPPAAWVEAVLEKRPSAVPLVAAIVSSGRGAADAMLPTIGMLNARFADLELMRSGANMLEWRRRNAQSIAKHWPAAEILRARKLLLALDLELKSRSPEGHLARIELATARIVDPQYC